MVFHKGQRNIRIRSTRYRSRLPAQDRGDRSSANQEEMSKLIAVSPLQPTEVAIMTLTRGDIVGYEFDRMVFLFSMLDGSRAVPCAVSAAAMDEIERVSRTAADGREQQFHRLRDR